MLRSAKLVLFTTIVGTLTVAASPAYAATKTRGDACRPGACGSANWYWDPSGYKIYDLDMGVDDTACDSSSVYIQLILYFGPGNSEGKRQRHENNLGCGHGMGWYNLAQFETIKIRAVKVQVCVNSIFTDECSSSPWIDNPTVP